MSNKEKRIVKYSYLAYYLCLLGAFIYCYKTKNTNGFNMGFVAMFTCFLAPLALRILKLKCLYQIHVINIVFALIASIGGSMLGAYQIPLFDKALHFSSGILISELALMLYNYLTDNKKHQSTKEQLLAITFVFTFNMTVAVLWEFFEYWCLIFLKNDAINHYTTGVHDSMTDMLVALIGGCIIIYYLIKYFKTNKDNFWTKLSKQFYQINFNIKD